MVSSLGQDKEHNQTPSGHLDRHTEAKVFTQFKVSLRSSVYLPALYFFSGLFPRCWYKYVYICDFFGANKNREKLGMTEDDLFFFSLGNDFLEVDYAPELLSIDTYAALSPRIQTELFQSNCNL